MNPMKARDPFAPDSDPYAPEAGDAPVLGRRALTLALAVLPLVASACAHRAPACAPQVGDAEHCKHRFCRHYGQSTTAPEADVTPRRG